MNAEQKQRDFTAGYKVVPDEPTSEMREAGHRAAWRSVPSLFDEDDAANVYRAMLAAAPAAPEPKSCGWIRAIDEAMVTHHLGVADIVDDYEAAKKKLNTLLSLNQDIGEYFSAKAPAPSVPDGWQPVPLSATVEMRNAGRAHLTGITSYADSMALKVYGAMVAAAPTPPEPPAELPTWENGDDPLVGGVLEEKGEMK